MLHLSNLLRAAAMGAIAAAVVSAVVAPATAKYPERPVTAIVAWPAGGATDLVTRGVQEAFGRALGQQIIVKNVPGAAGTIGTAEAAAAAPDGYTVLFTPSGPTVAQPHRMKLTYDLSSFEPVCKLVEQPLVLMTPKTSRFKTLADLIAAAKADPGKVAYGTAGPGSITHLAKLALEKAAGIKLKHVPHKGSADSIQSMLSGAVELYSDQANLVPQYDLHPIAVYAEKRIDTFKDTPTVREAGFDVVVTNYNGLFVPKGTPANVLEALGKACKAAMEDPGVIATFARQKYPIAYQDAKAFKPFVEADYERVGALVRAAGLGKK
jgi:tripartite-type tricarboxylate transporter receptor subunit TctC